jgi:hypothetical protein
MYVQYVISYLILIRPKLTVYAVLSCSSCCSSYITILLSYFICYPITLFYTVTPVAKILRIKVLAEQPLRGQAVLTFQSQCQHGPPSPSS